MLHLSHALRLGHKLMEKKSVHNLKHSPLPYLYISLRASYNLIGEQQCTVLRCNLSSQMLTDETTLMNMLTSHL